MKYWDKLLFLKTCLCLLIAYLAVTDASDRCGYVETPSNSKTVWVYEGEDVTLTCPGHIIDSSPSFTVKYEWYQQEYNCESMMNRVASYTNHIKGEPRIITEERMAIDANSGRLTISNVTEKDEQTFTCIFRRSQEHIATVHLKIKDFQQPVLMRLVDEFQESEVRSAECVVPKMRPTEGFIKVLYNDDVIKAVNLVEGDALHPVTIPIIGNVETNGDIVTCTAVQNISGSVKELSTTQKITVLYSYQTKVMSSVPDQPMEFSDVTLNCEVSRTGNPKEITGYTWLRNGQQIQGNHNITLRSVTDEDAGHYQCLITNKVNISTDQTTAEELQLEIVPLDCLPQLQFQNSDIKLDRKSLSASWKTRFPPGCNDYKPAIEISIQVHAGNETEEPLQGNILWISEEHFTIKGRFNISKNHEVCMIFKSYPENKYCVMTMESLTLYYIKLACLITGCVVLGCVAVAIILWTARAIPTRSSKRQNQTNQIMEEGQYRDLETCPELRDDPYEESGEPSLSPRNSMLPAPPLPLDVDGSRPLEHCPEADQHYRNRTAIMATIPRKPRFSVAKAESLEDIIEYCTETYKVQQNKSHEEAEPASAGDYMDMRGVASLEIELKEM